MLCKTRISIFKNDKSHLLAGGEFQSLIKEKYLLKMWKPVIPYNIKLKKKFNHLGKI